ncbi:MAG TPA: SurA N-terminal domain-containing protein, partial [Candidatus Angelobacter sp.]|nr:SurA N-terminal domain-containing protein [Candidatus Angelobacter sp.]
MIRFLQSGNRAVKFILSAFLLIICVSMVWYLVPGLNGSNTTTSGVLATVGGETIHTEDVSKLANDMLKKTRIPEQYRSLMMAQAVQRAAQQLFQEAEIRYEADRLGLTVSDQELRDELRSGQIGATLFPGGQWIGQDKYQELLVENGTTVEAFEQQIKMQLLSRKLFSTIVAAVDASPAEIEKLYKEQNTKVKFDYAVLKEEDLAKGIKPTDSELKAYYAAHQAVYENSIEEKRQLRYFVIADKDLQSKITVTQDEEQKYYNDHQN